MHYKESPKILRSVKAAKKILITSHKEPDEDSIGSIIALHFALKKIDIDSNLVCKDEAPNYLKFLPGVRKIKIVDYQTFEFNKYDLLVSLDSSSWGMIVGSELKDMISDIPIIVIDHHASNTGYGEINLLDTKATSVSEIVYKVISDWGVKIDKSIATNLLAGILGDTGSFRYPNVTPDTFETASKLMKLGANRDEIIHELFFSVEFKELKYLAEILKEAVLDEKDKIVWAAISYKKYKDLGEPEGAGFAGQFFQIVNGTELGIFMVEKKKNVLDVSLRARGNIDSSKIAVELGGGGHKKAAGAKIRDFEFEDAVEHVLKTVKKYTQ